MKIANEIIVFACSIILFLIIYGVSHHSPESDANHHILKEQERQAEDDKYIENWFRFGKDRYGNCWVWRNSEGSATLIECSKIGR